MLDDLKLIHERDSQDTLGTAENQWMQLEREYNPKIYDNFQPAHIVYCGMGGSALAAALSTSWPRYKIPFELVRNYDIPAYVSDETLFIASSYSGNTEETLHALSIAEERGAKILVISNGGKLLDHAKKHDYPTISVDQVRGPRYAVLGELKALVSLLRPYNVFAAEGIDDILHKTIEFLKEAVTEWVPTVPTASNPAKMLAQELIGQSVAVYAGPSLFPAAYKWKIDLNENAKQLAWTDAYPEFNHNEFLGWTKQPVQKPYVVVELRSNLEHPRTQRRFMVTERLLSGMRPAPHVVNVPGETLLEQLVWAVAFGDFVSLYVAILSGVNPGPVELMEKFKLEMNAKT
ncbi:SIS domain-containing protein [Candidatus Saccharibacteria bacterium]|nr:SIS domain-containing protein [Candidatus Saccharibacteria bacterium]